MTTTAYVQVGPMSGYPLGGPFPLDGDEYLDLPAGIWAPIRPSECVSPVAGETVAKHGWPEGARCRRKVRAPKGQHLCTRGDIIPDARSYSALVGFKICGEPIWSPVNLTVAGHVSLVLLAYDPLDVVKPQLTSDFGDRLMSRVQRNAFGSPGSPSAVNPGPGVVTLAAAFTGESRS